MVCPSSDYDKRHDRGSTMVNGASKQFADSRGLEYRYYYRRYVVNIQLSLTYDGFCCVCVIYLMEGLVG